LFYDPSDPDPVSASGPTVPHLVRRPTLLCADASGLGGISVSSSMRGKSARHLKRGHSKSGSSLKMLEIETDGPVPDAVAVALGRSPARSQDVSSPEEKLSAGELFAPASYVGDGTTWAQQSMKHSKSSHLPSAVDGSLSKSLSKKTSACGG
jgi:hypothetical protein